MNNYNIRFAKKEDIPSIMSFINEYWKENHILARDRHLFEWQYAGNDKLNMIIGESDDGNIHAILGYIAYSNNADKDISLALWKAKTGTAFLGVRLLMFLLQEEPHRNIFCNGININTTAEIYQRFGMKIGKLTQYYRLCYVEKYKIAKITEQHIPVLDSYPDINLKKVESMDMLIVNSTNKIFDICNVPFKSKDYISKRYFSHPSYDYLVYTVHEGTGKSDIAVVLRIQECNSSKALRLIDVIGNYANLGKVTHCIDKLANQFGAEYVDMYAYGLDEQMMLNAGWLKVGEDGNIIPNYFAPYTQCNVEINICTTDENIVLFKGDGDQDRPN